MLISTCSDDVIHAGWVQNELRIFGVTVRLPAFAILRHGGAINRTIVSRDDAHHRVTHRSLDLDQRGMV